MSIRSQREFVLWVIWDYNLDLDLAPSARQVYRELFRVVFVYKKQHVYSDGEFRERLAFWGGGGNPLIRYHSLMKKGRVYRHHILNGAKSIIMRLLFLRSQLFRFRPGFASPNCRWCGGVKETWDHLIWECPLVQEAYGELRRRGWWAAPTFPAGPSEMVGLGRRCTPEILPILFSLYVVMTNSQIDGVRFKEAFLSTFEVARLAFVK